MLLKGGFLLYQRNVAPNLYFYTHQKIPFFIGYVLFFFLFFLFLLFLFFFPIPKVVTGRGIYSCEEVCTISSYLPYETVKKLNEKSELFLDKQKIPLQIIEFAEMEEVNHVIYQGIVIEIPKQSYFEKETIEFTLCFQKDTFMSILWKSMKGGDES